MPAQQERASQSEECPMTGAGYPQELIYFIDLPVRRKSVVSLLQRNFSFRPTDDFELELGSRLDYSAGGIGEPVFRAKAGFRREQRP
jgi:hypothetical protein